MIRIAAMLLLLVTLPAAAQTLYKWVDEKGVTHYSETPPPTGDASKLNLKVEPGKAGSETWKQRELESRQRQAEKGKAERDQEAARAKQEQDQGSRCRRAQEALDRLKNSRRLYDLDAKGERVYIDDQDRPALLGKWQREADQNCR